ncbi:MAG: DUF2523 family protein [Proteobacteria bacterium]|nr:DUF2523 family protein [Pseudomonadota bacterium]
MAFPVLLAPLVTWIFRDIVVKFLVFSAVFALVALLVPKAITYLGGFINPGGLTSAFGAVGPGVWFFLDFFQLGYGVPLLISAWVSRFLIRRLPVIG